MFKDDSFKNSEAKKEYVKIKYAKNGWMTKQRKIPRIKIKRQEQGDFEMKERKHRVLMQEIQYSSNVSHRTRKQRERRQRQYQQEEKSQGGKAGICPLEERLDFILFPAWTELMETDHHSDLSS